MLLPNQIVSFGFDKLSQRCSGTPLLAEPVEVRVASETQELLIGTALPNGFYMTPLPNLAVSRHQGNRTNQSGRNNHAIRRVSMKSPG